MVLSTIILRAPKASVTTIKAVATPNGILAGTFYSGQSSLCPVLPLALWCFEHAAFNRERRRSGLKCLPVPKKTSSVSPLELSKTQSGTRSQEKIQWLPNRQRQTVSVKQVMTKEKLQFHSENQKLRLSTSLKQKMIYSDQKNTIST